MLGTTISHYRIIAKLGEGGMGEVYRAEDTRLGRAVALKLMTMPHEGSGAAETWERLVREAAEEKAPFIDNSGRPHSDDARSRFLREARTVSALNHPGIVTIYDVGEWEGRLFIAMELVEGETLRKKLERAGLDTKGVLKIAISLAEALGRAHQAGVTHRDIKPENVILSDEGQTKLLDFGIAKLRRQAISNDEHGAAATMNRSLTTPGALLGTVHYMSPEQTLQLDTDPRSDLFSLGSVIYECLAGRKAFDGPMVDAMYHIAHDAPPPIRQFNSRVPEDLERIVDKLMEKERDDRYQNAGDLLVDLRRAERHLNGLTGSLRVLPAPIVVPAPPKRRVVAMIVAGVLVGAIAAFLATHQTAPAETQVYPVTHLRRNISYPALSPDGKLLTFISGDNQVYVALATSGEATQLTRTPGPKAFPRFSSDGARIMYSALDTWEVWQVPALGGEPQRLLTQAGFCVRSPDGTRLAFSRIEANAGDWNLGLYVSGARGENPKRLASIEAVPNIFSAWTPDGKQIVYMEAYQKRRAPRLQVVAADGSSPPRSLVTDDLIPLPPAVSPDGKWAYYSAIKSGVANLWRVKVAGGVPEQVSFSTGEDRSPALDPNGWLYYVSARHRSRLHLLSADGDKLIADDQLLAEAHLSPDGKRIAFVRPAWAGTALGDLMLLNVEDGHITHLDTAGPVSDMQWSRDGKQLGYSSRAGNMFEAHAIDVDTGKGVTVPGATDRDSWFRGFSPAGEMLIERLRRDQTFGETVIFNPAANQERVAATVGSTFGWSNDGKWVGLYQYSGDNGKIFLAPAAGGPPQLLYEGAVSSPWFARDREEVLFISRQSPPQFGSIAISGGSPKPYVSRVLLTAVSEYGSDALADIDTEHERVLVKVNESDMDIVRRKANP